MFLDYVYTVERVHFVFLYFNFPLNLSDTSCIIGFVYNSLSPPASGACQC